jgi:hypothetical protein
MFRLAADRLLPLKTEPGEIAIDGVLIFGPATAEVDVLDPQQKAAAGPPTELEAEQGRKRVAKMKLAVRRGGKSENGLHAVLLRSYR